MLTFLKENPEVSRLEMAQWLGINIARCTIAWTRRWKSALSNWATSPAPSTSWDILTCMRLKAFPKRPP
jgi:hypothetical protein